MLRVVTLSTLFPDATRPVFGVFVERQTLGLAARDGVEVEVVAPIGLAPWPLSRHRHYRRFEEVAEQEDWKGLTVHRPRFRVMPRIGDRFAPALMARRLIPMLHAMRARFPFDVIDAEFFWPDGPAAMRVARALGIPFSIKARGADIHYWGARAGCRDQMVEAARAAGGLLAVSEALREDMMTMGMRGEKIAVHRTGIDRDRFNPEGRTEARIALGVAGPLIVSVGALIARKNQALVIEAMRGLPEALLILVGEGPERAALETRVAASGLSGRVRFAGSIAHEDLPRLLKAADVMALPSASEGLANAWVEALACGTPIVIAGAGGARELVDREAAGRIVAREPEAIRGAIADILAAPPDPVAVAATVASYSWERNAEQLEAHLRNIAGK